MKLKVVLPGLGVLSTLLCLSCTTPAAVDYWPTAQWRTAAPERAGMDGKKLKEIDAYVEETAPRTTSVLVVRSGFIVFERYAGDAGSRRALYSVTKSILSALAGVALDQGYLSSLDQRMIDFFPEYVNDQTNPQAEKVTLRNLLTMSDGISSDWLDFHFQEHTLSEPFRNAPGAGFFYNSMSPQIVSIIITKATGQKALDFGRQYLFQPLGILNILWAEDWGYSRGAYGMLLTTRDMAKIGYLYLRNGRWDGRQLVPKQWVVESTRTQIQTGKPSGYWENYGYYWWVHNFGGHDGFYAYGLGGQLICVVPSLDIVAVVTTSETSEDNREGYLAIVEKYVVGAIE